MGYSRLSSLPKVRAFSSILTQISTEVGSMYQITLGPTSAGMEVRIVKPDPRLPYNGNQLLGCRCLGNQ